MAFFFRKIWPIQKKAVPLHSLSANKVERAFSSAGLEHLPYKQRVGGSNPSTPTTIHTSFRRAFSSAGLEHLPYKQRVGGSNPSTPTTKTASAVFFLRIYHPKSMLFCPTKRHVNCVFPEKVDTKILFCHEKRLLYMVFSA